MASTKKSLQSIIRRPMITEKGAYSNSLVFEVHRLANKIEISNAIEKIFNVKVNSVRTLNYLGKPVKSGTGVTTLSNWKKAYVSLEPGRTIDLVEGL